MAEPLALLEPEFGAWKIFRPNRDVRFSADKSPYKTNIAATLELGGYVELSSEGLAAGCGYWHLAPDQLGRYREAVLEDSTGAELVELLDALRRAGIEAISHSELKTAPRGIPKDHPRIDLLRCTTHAAFRSFDIAPWLHTAEAKDRIAEAWRRLGPLMAWLERHTA